MDRLDALRSFVRVIETGSFSAVARELAVGQPAVSKQIAALEAQVGARLLFRTSRRLSATQAGADLYAVAAQSIAELDAALARAARGESLPAGLVRLTAAPAFGRSCLVPRLPELLARYPELSVEVLASERHLNLIEDRIDLAVRTGDLVDSNLIAHPLGSTPLLLVASRAYLEGRGEPKLPSELGQHAQIGFVTRRASRSWRFRGPDGTFEVQPQARFRANHAEEIRAAVLAHLGIAQVPGWLVANDIASGSICALLREYEPAPLAIAALRSGGRRISRRVRTVLDFLLEIFESEPMLGGTRRTRHAPL
jgi:LysR family transcriptional regulator for bpeEF and oprC